MKKFLLIAAALFTMTAASAQQSWDFSVVPTQTIDATGNMTYNDPCVGGAMATDPNKWGAFMNAAPVLDGHGLEVKKGEAFELTKGITFDLLGDAKMVMFRNYPEEYGGMHMYINKPLVMYLPVKAGSKVTFTICSPKSRKLTFEGVTQDVKESTNGAEYGQITFDVTEDNPPLEFTKDKYYIKAITVQNSGDVNGINDVTVDSKADSRMFNLQGQRISKPLRGQVYLKNGRKYIGR